MIEKIRKIFHKEIYLDHAAATPLDEQALRAMYLSMGRSYANPSALYRSAISARADVENAREKIADFLSARSENIVFTGGGTESINLAIHGILSPLESGHIITTAFEHSSVLRSIKYFESRGFDVTYLPVDESKNISLRSFEDALREDTVLVSIMYANNEIGSILPIQELGRAILKWRKNNHTAYPYFHSDACQATEYLDMNVERLHVDLLSINASKIYGPKGVGALYVGSDVDIEPQILGGGQERGLRSGTENVAGIVGFGVAIEQVSAEEVDRVRALRNYLALRIGSQIPDTVIHTPLENSLPNNLNVGFSGVDVENLILYLDEFGIVCSSGSACATDSGEVSHVITAIGGSPREARESVRFTLGRSTTDRDIDRVMSALPGVVARVRNQKNLTRTSEVTVAD
jgi:cysteine desulfurase